MKSKRMRYSPVIQAQDVIMVNNFYVTISLTCGRDFACTRQFFPPHNHIARGRKRRTPHFSLSLKANGAE